MVRMHHSEHRGWLAASAVSVPASTRSVRRTTAGGTPGAGQLIGGANSGDGFVDGAMGVHDDLQRMGYTIRTKMLAASAFGR